MPLMGSLLIITGPPGAGKSAVASNIAERLDKSVLVAGDSFFGFLASGTIEPWLPSAYSQNETVIKAAAAATGRFVHGEYHTIYDGVVGPWFLPTFAEAAGLRKLDYVMLVPPIEVCLERVLQRQSHGFTDEAATRDMHRDFAGAQIDPRHVIDNARASSHETADLVLYARDNETLAYERL